MAKFTQQTWSLTQTRDMIDVTSDRPTVDPMWRGTDSNGHEHYYDHGYVTLDLVIDASHWCDGHEGMYNHDPHEAIDESHYECLICREVVNPGLVPAGWQNMIPGMITSTLEGWRSDGVKVVVDLSEAEVEAFRHAEDTNAAVQTFLDTVPPERISSMSFSR